MNIESVYQQLDGDITRDEAEYLLDRFLSDQVAQYKQHPEHAQEIAYGIAGLLSARTIMSLPKDDPYIAILHMAARLELPDEHQSPGVDWSGFIQSVEALQNK